MKRILAIFTGLIVIVAQLHAADALTEALQKGLFEEEANQNLEAAIKAYQDVLTRADEQRRVAATALFRLAECYRKQGKTNEASGEYRRLLRDYGDQSTLVNLSRQNLAGLGVAAQATAPGERVLASTDEEEKEIRRIKALIKDSPDLINARDPNPGGSTLLHKAASSGYYLVAEYLLSNGADVNSYDLYNSMPNATPLHNAAAQGHKRLVELLLAKGALPNAGDFGGRTPLHFAVNKGFRAVAEVLLTNKADINARDNSGRTPLHTTVPANHLEMARFLVERGADLGASLTAGGDMGALQTPDGTPLHIAVQHLKPRFVELFLRSGADPNARTERGLTPLHYTCTGGDMPDLRREMAALLIEHKADLNARGTRQVYPDLPPLHIAVAVPALTNLVQLLLEKGADPNLFVDSPQSESTALLTAVVKRNFVATELLLKHGANVDAPNRHGSTPLYYAAAYGPAGIVDLLLRSKADPNSVPSRSPLVTPVNNNDVAIAELLLAKGANPNVTNSHGYPVLHLAVAKYGMQSSPSGPAGSGIPHRTLVRTPSGERPPPSKPASNPNKTTLELLLEYKADPNIRNPAGQTALHFALSENRFQAMELLLSSNADVNAPDSRGYTPLHFAASGNGNPDAVRLLLRHKANPNALDDSRATPLFAGLRNTNIIGLLAKSGADINWCDGEGDTPLLKALKMRASSPTINDTPFLQTLLDLGADILKTCNDQPSPFEYTIRANDSSRAEMLRKYHPKKLARIKLEGPVQRTFWYFEADQPKTLSQVISEIGLTDKADPHKVSIVRDDPKTNLKVSKSHDLFMIRGKTQPDVPLQEGDKITIAER